MSFITLDYETSFSSGKVNPDKFSLFNMTYEDYINDPRFFVYGVGIKIDDQDTVWYHMHDTDLDQLMAETFPDGNDHTFLAHNTLFDAAILCWYYRRQAATYYCSLMMSTGLWRYESASLANLAKRLWPQNRDMRKGKELALADGLLDPAEYTPEIMNYIGGYCIQDCDLTFAAFAKMYHHFPAEELEVIDDVIKMFAHRPLVLNHDLVVNYQQELEAKRLETFTKAGVSREVLASSDKFIKMLADDHGIVVNKVPSPTLKNPKNKKYPLAKDDLGFMKLRNEHPELDHLWEGRIAAASNQESTRCSRFLAHGMISPANPDGNIAIPLKYCGAGTTRFSGTNSINMQNLGRTSKLRHALTAPKGHKLIISDLSNIEGRMNAFHAGADWKLKKYAEAVDLYNEIGTKIFGRPIDRKGADKDEGYVAKTAELGLGYGMGVSKFIESCHKGPMGAPPMPWVDEELGSRTVNTWRTENNEIATSWRTADAYLEIMAQPMARPMLWNTIEIHHQGIQLPSGLFIQYPRLKYDKSAFRNDDGSDRWTWMYWNGKFWQDIWGGVFINNTIQGISRVVMTQAEVRIKERFAANGINGMLVMQVHDELIFCVPDAAVEEAQGIVAEELTRVPSWCDNRLVLGCSMDVSDFYIKG